MRFHIDKLVTLIFSIEEELGDDDDPVEVDVHHYANIFELARAFRELRVTVASQAEVKMTYRRGSAKRKLGDARGEPVPVERRDSFEAHGNIGKLLPICYHGIIRAACLEKLGYKALVYAHKGESNEKKVTRTVFLRRWGMLSIASQTLPVDKALALVAAHPQLGPLSAGIEDFSMKVKTYCAKYVTDAFTRHRVIYPLVEPNSRAYAKDGPLPRLEGSQ